MKPQADLNDTLLMAAAVGGTAHNGIQVRFNSGSDTNVYDFTVTATAASYDATTRTVTVTIPAAGTTTVQTVADAINSDVGDVLTASRSGGPCTGVQFNPPHWAGRVVTLSGGSDEGQAATFVYEAAPVNA